MILGDRLKPRDLQAVNNRRKPKKERDGFKIAISNLLRFGVVQATARDRESGIKSFRRRVNHTGHKTMIYGGVSTVRGQKQIPSPQG